MKQKKNTTGCNTTTTHTEKLFKRPRCVLHSSVRRIHIIYTITVVLWERGYVQLVHSAAQLPVAVIKRSLNSMGLSGGRVRC